VTLAGFQSNPWKYIARAQLFLLTSRYEGFGNVLIEAMACGVPVVATASAGTRDIVDHQVDGMLVDVHSPTAVAASVIAIVESPARRQAMARAARNAADRFAVGHVLARYEQVLELLAA